MSAIALCLGCDRAIEHGELCQLCRGAVTHLRSAFHAEHKMPLPLMSARIAEAEYTDTEHDLWYIPVPAPVRTT